MRNIISDGIENEEYIIHVAKVNINPTTDNDPAVKIKMR